MKNPIDETITFHLSVLNKTLQSASQHIIAVNRIIHDAKLWHCIDPGTQPEHVYPFLVNLNNQHNGLVFDNLLDKKIMLIHFNLRIVHIHLVCLISCPCNIVNSLLRSEKRLV